MLSSLLRCCAVLVVALLLSSAAVQAADTLTIVADGRSDYVIALDSKASESETWAAKELADHLKQMSGAELKIVTIDDGQPIPEQAIVLGWQLATTLGTGPAQGEMATDDYLIQALGQRLIIAGSAKRGTMYGVYGLLDELGVRWWTPTETTVPKNATVFVNTAQRLARPTLEYQIGRASCRVRV